MTGPHNDGNVRREAVNLPSLAWEIRRFSRENARNLKSNRASITQLIGNPSSTGARVCALQPTCRGAEVSRDESRSNGENLE